MKWWITTRVRIFWDLKPAKFGGGFIIFRHSHMFFLEGGVWRRIFGTTFLIGGVSWAVEANLGQVAIDVVGQTLINLQLCQPPVHILNLPQDFQISCPLPYPAPSYQHISIITNPILSESIPRWVQPWATWPAVRSCTVAVPPRPIPCRWVPWSCQPLRWPFGSPSTPAAPGSCPMGHPCSTAIERRRRWCPHWNPSQTHAPWSPWRYNRWIIVGGLMLMVDVDVVE